MSLPKFMDYATSQAGVAVNGVAETVIQTSPGMVMPSTFNRVLVIGWTTFNPGADITTVIPKLRSGTDTTGPNLNPTLPHTITAGAGQKLQFTVIGEQGCLNQAGATYVYTMTQGGGVANGATIMSAILVMVF